MKYRRNPSLFEHLESRQLLSADLSKLIDSNNQPRTSTYPSPFIASSFNAKINFQPSSVSTSKLPSGYKADNGAKYAARNGLSYGWTSDNSANLKVRNSSKSPDVRYDTFAQFTNSKKWEIKVPSGTYYVRYTVGDPGTTAVAVNDISVEGKFSLHEHTGANSYWIERGIYVNVTDGKLTLTTSLSSTQKIDWIEIAGQTSKPPTPTSMTWQSSDIQAPLGRNEAESIQIGNKLYILGGFTNDFKSVTNHMDIFDMSTQTWSSGADLPETQTHQAVCTDGRYIYQIGGQVGTRYNDLGWHGTTNSYRYDTQTNTWSPFIAAPAVWFAPACQIVNNKIYVLAGAGPNRNDPVTTCWVLDLNQSTPTWKTIASMPFAQEHMSSTVIGQKIYVIGGDHDHSEWHAEHDYTFVYDIPTNKWTRLANVPIQGSHFEGSLFQYQGRIFALGGAGDGQVPLWRVSAYDPATNKWAEFAHSPVGRLGGAAGIMGNKIFYMGGSTITADKHTIDSVTMDIGTLPDLGDPETPPPPDPGPTTSLGSSADTYTRGGVNAAASYVGDASINVKAGTGDNAREGLIRFDLSSITTITSAKLRLFGKLNTSGSVNVGIYGLDDTQLWDETTSWNTRPTISGSSIGSAVVNSTTEKWYEIDITSYLNALKAAGKTTVAFGLKSTTSSTPFASFRSREAASNGAQIEVVA
jgi:N-acetylneuraminic acid mutarotase